MSCEGFISHIFQIFSWQISSKLVTFPFSILQNNACYKNPCKYGGECQPDGDYGYKCKCLEGYYGDHCQVSHTRFKYHYILIHFFFFFLFFSYVLYSSFVIWRLPIIAQMFTITLSILQNNACYNNPCKYGGECHPDGDYGYKCKCLKGYYGDHCQVGDFIKFVSFTKRLSLDLKTF